MSQQHASVRNIFLDFTDSILKLALLCSLLLLLLFSTAVFAA